MQTDGQDNDLGESLAKGNRQLVAIMFTDIVGFTALTQNNEGLALDLLDEHRKLLRPILASHSGKEIKTIGDSFMVEFQSALDAVECAIKLQQILSQRNSGSTSTRQIYIRIGIHVGDVVKAGNDVYGDAVNLAQRIESICEPGDIAISAQVYDQVRNKISIPIQNMEERMLKNVATPTAIYRIHLDQKKTIRSAPDVQRRFAVLPLTNMGESDEYLADGLTEELISAFSRLPNLKVVARTTMMRFKGAKKSISEIGRELNVNNILEGSVRKHGNRLRVTVQLIETSTEEYLWSENYDSNIDDILNVQRDVAEKTSQTLKSKMGYRAPLSLESRKTTENPEAFLLFLRGRFHLARHTESEVKTALKFFEEAIHVDPNFAAAHAFCAQCHMFLGFFGFISPKDGFEKAMPALEKAIAIDDDLDIAHMLMGRLLQDKWDWLGSEAEFRRAIEISPNSAEAHYRYALLLNDLRRTDEAVSEVKMAEELDPLSIPVNQITGTILCFAGNYDDAIERFHRALDMEPKAALAQNNLGVALFEKGHVDEGIGAVKKALELDPNNMMFRADLCYLLSRAGRIPEGEELLAQSVAKLKTEHVSPVALAGMNSCLGEKQSAITWLEKAFEEHSPYLASLLVERWFDNLRAEPGFANILKKVGLRR